MIYKSLPIWSDCHGILEWFDLHIVIWVFKKRPEQANTVQVSDLGSRRSQEGRLLKLVWDLGVKKGGFKTFDLGTWSQNGFHIFDRYTLLQYHQFNSEQLTQLVQQTNKCIKQTNNGAEVPKERWKWNECINASVYKCCNGAHEPSTHDRAYLDLRPRDLLRSKKANGEIWWDTGLGRAEGTWST